MDSNFDRWWAESYGEIGSAVLSADIDTFKLMMKDAFEAGEKSKENEQGRVP